MTQRDNVLFYKTDCELSIKFMTLANKTGVLKYFSLECIDGQIPRYKKIWEPYCTVATWYLWRDIDEDIVQY